MYVPNNFSVRVLVYFIMVFGVKILIRYNDPFQNGGHKIGEVYVTNA